ncbi:outer membrane beta-barrel protein [Vibrio phage Marilyn]|nr:outer membrane beta-barrel protein [Vibrio phage Marilyn]WCD55578.1 outer membrane beta-barrel protein [Vibrio phage Fayden]WCD55637.1 outer membrane beta-barrel protein [Vibrio phage Baybae]WCD55694.1 outer membrane beta-barrel protein [Vibrio phage Vaitephage]
MKSKLLIAIAVTVGMMAMPSLADEQYKGESEILVGYTKADIKNSEELHGANLEYRNLAWEYFGYGAGFVYTQTSVGGGDVSLYSGDAFVMLRLPTSIGYFYSRYGASYTAIDVSAYNPFDGDTETVTDGDLSFFYGVGANIKLYDRWNFDLSVNTKEPKFNLGYGKTNKAQMLIWSANLAYRF